MRATVVENQDGVSNQDGKVSTKVKVWPSSKIEHLDRFYSDLQPGDRVEVKRVVNNPYLVRVTK